MAALSLSNGEDAVPCDSCMDAPGRAVKSCLTCLVSYCEAHLRPHLENAKFRSHRLVGPLHEVGAHRACPVHRLPLEHFCLTDGCCVCPECEGHRGHAVAPAREARVRIETEVQRQREEILRNASAAEKTIEQLQSNSDAIKSAVEEMSAVVEQQFDRVRATVEEARRGVTEELRGERRRALAQADGIRAHVEQGRSELAKTLARMDNMCRVRSDVDFLQEYSEWRGRATDVRLAGVTVSPVAHLTLYVQALSDATRELCDLISSFYRDKPSMFRNDGKKSQAPEAPVSSLDDPETREDFLKYTRSLTFDPDTAHRFLRATEDGGKLTNTSPWQHDYPDHPDRFDYWRQALTSQSVYLGRHYVEAELSGDGAHVGVAYRSIERKGERGAGCVTGSGCSWCVGRSGRGVSAWHAGLETPLEVAEVRRLGVYVDFGGGGAVSFYDATGPMRLLHKYQAEFTEPLYVAVWLSKTDNVVSLVNAE